MPTAAAALGFPCRNPLVNPDDPRPTCFPVPRTMETSTQVLASPAAGASVLVGRILEDRYRIDVVLGEGGMGAVYQAEHLLMHKRVAIKILHPELTRVPEVVARFEREAMAAAHIDHPNVAAATDFGKLSDGSFFLVLEFVEGRSLRELIAEGPLAPSRAASVGKQVLAGLSRAHGLGIVHRDLKPENVMLIQRDGVDDFVKILDFGIAKVPMGDLVAQGGGPSREPLTQQGMVYGTPEYMAPEQALGEEVDARADLYALGVLMFEMMMGRRPFDAPSKVQILGMVVSKPVPTFQSVLPEHDAPPALEAFVRQLLAKTPDARFPDAKAALEALEAIDLSAVAAPLFPALGGPNQGPGAAVQPPRPRPSSTLSGSRGLLLAAAGGLALAGVVIVVLVASRGEKSAPTTPGKLVAAESSASAIEKSAPTEAEVAATTDLAAAEALLKKYPDDVKTAVLVVDKALAEKQYARALEQIEATLPRDPRLAAKPEVRAGLLAAANSAGTADAAFALLRSAKLGPDGPDVLFELAFGKDAAGPSQKQATTLIGQQDVRDRASAALRVALDLRATSSLSSKAACEARNKLLPVAKENGDARAAAFIKPLTVASCGYFHNKPCFPCLGRADVSGTLAAVEARPFP
jgi:eukaryotic-like serine/threonine-protein kinase